MIDKDIRFSRYGGGRKFLPDRDPAYGGFSSHFKAIWDRYAEHAGRDGPFNFTDLMDHAELPLTYSANETLSTGTSFVVMYQWPGQFSTSGMEGYVHYHLAVIARDGFLIAITLVSPAEVFDLIANFVEPVQKLAAFERHTRAIEEQTKILSNISKAI
jgi:hypothetical protein